MSTILAGLLKSKGTPLIRRMQQHLFKLEQEERRDPALSLQHVKDESQWLLAQVRHTLAQCKQGATRDRTKKKFHPSSASGCRRALWLRMMGAPKNMPYDAEGTARMRMIFRNGDYTHLRLQYVLYQMGLLKQAEVAIEDSALNLEGHTDGILAWEGEDVVLEIKSINSRGFAGLMKTGKPKDEHVEQANLYMHGTKCRKAVFLYENKDTQLWAEFWIAFSPRMFTQQAGTFRTIRQQLSSGKAPSREGDMPGCPVCKWCEYTHTCFNEERMRTVEKVRPRMKFKFKVRRWATANCGCGSMTCVTPPSTRMRVGVG